jgi:hypothetical protein
MATLSNAVPAFMTMLILRLSERFFMILTHFSVIAYWRNITINKIKFSEIFCQEKQLLCLQLSLVDINSEQILF